MPPEVGLLRNKPEPLDLCPSCGTQPFRSFLRGSVQRSRLWAPVAWLRAWWRGEEFEYCAVICSQCKDIVGYETPEVRGQTCWVYCPACRLELTASPRSFVRDTDGIVVYDCERCRLISKWDFTAPTPLLLQRGIVTGGPQ